MIPLHRAYTLFYVRSALPPPCRGIVVFSVRVVSSLFTLSVLHMLSVIWEQRKKRKKANKANFDQKVYCLRENKKDRRWTMVAESEEMGQKWGIGGHAVWIYIYAMSSSGDTTRGAPIMSTFPKHTYVLAISNPTMFYYTNFNRKVLAFLFQHRLYTDTAILLSSHLCFYLSFRSSSSSKQRTQPKPTQTSNRTQKTLRPKSRHPRRWR